MNPKLKFFLRKISEKEIEEMTTYSPPTYEDWEFIYGYEPTKAHPTYDHMLATYDAHFKKINSEALPTLTIDKVVILLENDSMIEQTENRSDFIRWTDA
jgi:hypothetical protein